ncbi:hypothetical protein PanWU01x14_289570 [Parasponia andersonii]|uniref:RNase H type-1 domain-containing protein n=1 Tax=Parasponia andersonii TaxID=3476 RepID=A0A2P5AXZ8_PARAD|nr:hypothetical protein PanWU01x14_289570 [Parasponia andersonii]
MGAGAVIRDSQSAVIRAQSKAAELIAIREGPLFAEACALHVSYIKSDHLAAVQAINSTGGLSPNDLVVGDIISFMSVASRGPCNFVPGEGNKVAHLLAKLSFNISNDVLCYENIPNSVATLVAYDILS